jgi:hypothetical protein
MTFDLQTLFYTVSIVTMLTWLAILLVVLAIALRVRKTVEQLKSVSSAIQGIRNIFKKK